MIIWNVRLWNVIKFHLVEGGFCLLLEVSSGCAGQITEQVSSVTWPVIVLAYSELSPSKGQKTGACEPETVYIFHTLFPPLYMNLYKDGGYLSPYAGFCILFICEIGIILFMRSDNERRRYSVTPFPIG